MKLRPNTALFIVFLISSGILLGCGLTTGHDWGDDFAAYIMQARSVAEGNPGGFIAANRLTLEGSDMPLGPMAYPWGFPVLLSPVYALFGMNLLALKSVGAICFLFFLAVLAFGFRETHGTGWRVALVSLFAFNPLLLQFVNQILSDLPFLFLSTLAALFIRRLVVDCRTTVSRVADPLLLGMVIALACFVRSNGWLLLGVLGVTQVVEAIRRRRAPDAGPAHEDAMGRNGPPVADGGGGRWLAALPYIAFAAAMAPWQLVFPEGESSHFAFFRSLSLRGVLGNLHYYLKLPSEFFQPLPEGARLLVFGAGIPLAVWGALRRSAADYPLIVYVATTFLLYVLWPIPQGPRMLFPVLPFYVSFLLSGLERVSAAGSGRRALRRALCAGPVVAIIVVFLGCGVMRGAANLRNHRQEPTGPHTAASQEMLAFISRNTEPDAIIVFARPRAMRLFTDRRAILATTEATLSAGNTVCLSREEVRRQIAPETARELVRDGRLVPVFGNSVYDVYRIVKRP